MPENDRLDLTWRLKG